MNKKLIPHDIAAPVEKCLVENADIIANKKEVNCFYSIYDLDESAGYYFKILVDHRKEAPQSNPDADSYLCCRFPLDLNNIKPYRIFIKKKDIPASLNSWVEAIKTFNSTPSVYDDPFVKRYQEYFYDEIKIEDADAESAPYNPMQQDAIEIYLQYVEQKLLGYKEEVEGDDAVVLDEIISDTRETIQGLATFTKNKAFKRITGIWAKVYKWKKSLAKEIMTKAKEELFKELVKEGVKYLPTLIRTLKDPDIVTEIMK